MRNMDSAPREIPEIFDYTVFVDGDGLTAVFRGELGAAALEAGCQRVMHAPDVLTLTQEIVRNRVRIWVWQTRPRGLASIAEWSGVLAP